MTLSTILLIGFCASVLSVVIFGFTLTFTHHRDRSSTGASFNQAYDFYRAVRTVWYQTALHLDALEQDGVDVTAVRKDLTRTVEQLLTGQRRNQYLVNTSPSQNPRPDAVGRFGSFRIFG